MTRGVVLDAALAAAPMRKGRTAGLPVRPRDLSFARALRAVLSAIRIGNTCYQALTSEIGKYRNVVGRDRHRARKSKSPSSFAHATAKDTATRIAPPSSPWPTLQPDQRKYRKPARNGTLPDRGPGRPWHDTPAFGMPAGRQLPAVTKNRNYPQPVKHLKPVALGHPVPLE